MLFFGNTSSSDIIFVDSGDGVIVEPEKATMGRVGKNEDGEQQIQAISYLK
jgi:hypothetical protein